MSRKRKPQEEEDHGIPGWLVSFTDMITLLLSFFVLLQSIAHIKDPDLFFIGQGSFNRAIQAYGMPKLLYGDPRRIERSWFRRKNPMEENPDDYRLERILDAEDAAIREVFDQIRQEIDTTSRNVEASATEIRPTNVRFSGFRVELSDAARAEVRKICSEVRKAIGGSHVRVYVLGLAPDRPNDSQRMIISARRARATEKYMREVLASELQSGLWEMKSLGAGTSRRWQSLFDGIDRKTHVVLAIVRASE